MGLYIFNYHTLTAISRCAARTDTFTDSQAINCPVVKIRQAGCRAMAQVLAIQVKQ